MNNTKSFREEVADIIRAEIYETNGREKDVEDKVDQILSVIKERMPEQPELSDKEPKDKLSPPDEKCPNCLHILPCPKDCLCEACSMQCYTMKDTTEKKQLSACCQAPLAIHSSGE